MPDWVRVAPESEFPHGTRRHVNGHDADIVVLRVAEGYFAVTDVCPHKGGPVGDGPVDGTTITCPRHQWRFDLRTGGEVRNPVARLVVHDVKVEGGVVWVNREAKSAP